MNGLKKFGNIEKSNEYSSNLAKDDWFKKGSLKTENKNLPIIQRIRLVQTIWKISGAMLLERKPLWTI